MITKKELRDIVNRYDPIGLLDFCPENEYDPEIERIRARVKKGMTADEIAVIIHAVFLEMFDESLDNNLSMIMAKEILFQIYLSST